MSLKNLWRIADPEGVRNEWIIRQLKALPAGGTLLDAGCGFQPYREHCSHLTYKSQDFGQYEGGNETAGAEAGMQWEDGTWHYGKLDYTGDIWAIDAPDASFDAILCSEVLEHIPYPGETIVEFSRLLKPGGTLILTAPYACLPHMNPYFFSSGYSKEFYEHFSGKAGMELVETTKYGDAFSYIFQEMKRSISYVDNRLLKGLYLGVFALVGPLLKLFIRLYGTRPDAQLLCFGYFILARKR